MIPMTIAIPETIPAQHSVRFRAITCEGTATRSSKTLPTSTDLYIRALIRSGSTDCDIVQNTAIQNNQTGITPHHPNVVNISAFS